MLPQSEGYKGWSISQEWYDVLFIHYEVPTNILQKLTPFPLDLYMGKAYVSVVPFQMKGIRLPYLPSISGLSSLWELNLRTYVKVGQKKGVYFFTLDTDSLLGEFIARKFFHLPYNHAIINAKVAEKSYEFHHQRNAFQIDIKASIGSQKDSSPFDLWATERYSLFTQNHEHAYEGRVHHMPWQLHEIEDLELNDHFSKMLPLITFQKPKSVSYSKKLNVWFEKFEKIGQANDIH